MGEALAEAQLALDQGKAPIGAVAVVSDAMVARAHDKVQESNDPTAHAVIVALREAARKLGRDRLADATIFVTREPCPMCVGALLACDVEALRRHSRRPRPRRQRDGRGLEQPRRRHARAPAPDLHRALGPDRQGLHRRRGPADHARAGTSCSRPSRSRPTTSSSSSARPTAPRSGRPSSRASSASTSGG